MELGYIVATLIISNLLSKASGERRSFPEAFWFGAGSSAYQVEGAWNVSDKSISTWDYFTHNYPEAIVDRSNGDVANDFYHRYEEDLLLAKELGFDVYRISISWSRVLPHGFSNYISKDGIEFYNKVIDEMLDNGLRPLVTIFHWDLPQKLEDMGGWTNELMVEWYADYANVIFNEFGDRVKIFCTMNEIMRFCAFSYGIEDVTLAPGKKLGNYGPYLCVHNMLKAHAKAYRIYDEKYRSIYHGEIGMAIDCNGYVPLNATDQSDLRAAEIAFEFHCGWVSNPIWNGDYPDLLKEKVAEASKIEGYERSRLPIFTPEWIKTIKGTSDFFGLNYYLNYAATAKKRNNAVSAFDDSGVTVFKLDGQGLLEGYSTMFRRLKKKYNDPKIIVTENGFGDAGETNDHERRKFFENYLKATLESIEKDDVNVIGYCLWALFDNFEWNSGYARRFGIYSVDFQSSTLNRTAKLSAETWRRFLLTREVNIT